MTPSTTPPRQFSSRFPFVLKGPLMVRLHIPDRGRLSRGVVKRSHRRSKTPRKPAFLTSPSLSRMAASNAPHLGIRGKRRRLLAGALSEWIGRLLFNVRQSAFAGQLVKLSSSLRKPSVARSPCRTLHRPAPREPTPTLAGACAAAQAEAVEGFLRSAADACHRLLAAVPG